MKFSLLSSVSTVAIGGLMVAALPGAAQAGLTCTSATFSCTETVSLAPKLTDFTNQPINLDQWNQAPYEKLTSVVISEVYSNFVTTGFLKNTSTSTESFIFTGGLSLNLKKTTGTPSGFSNLANTVTLPKFSATLAPSGSTPYSLSKTFVGTPTETITGTSNVAGFIGNSTIPFLFNALAQSSFSGGGNNIQTHLTTFATASATITYHYSVTSTAPEPASLAVLGAGVAGLGVARRRRQKAS